MRSELPYQRRCSAVTMVAVVLSFLGISGCGGELPATASGTVTLDSQPLTSGLVTFYPVDRGPAALASICADGQFVIKTGNEAGMKVGDYVVTVEAFDVSNNLQQEEEIALSLTPARYSDRAKSDLKFTVLAGPNQIDLALVSN